MSRSERKHVCGVEALCTQGAKKKNGRHEIGNVQGHRVHVAAHACDPSTWKAETGQPGLHSELHDSLNYRVRPCL